jgi:hypothetical protein
MLPRSAAEGGNSSNRIAASIASGLKCMYRCVVPRSRWPANFCTAGAGAPRIERCEQNVRRNKRSRVPRLVTGCEPCLARRALEQVREHVGPERLTVLLTQHACAPQVPMPPQRNRESGRHRDVPHAIAMTSRPPWSAWSSTSARPSALWRATWT